MMSWIAKYFFPFTKEPEEKQNETSSLDQRQIKLIRDSWDLVSDKKQEVGVALFIRLFEIAPGLETLFPFGPDPNSPGLRAHALNVVETVGTAVDNLEKLDVLVPVLKDLGKVHAPFELSAKDYEAVGQALLDTLQDGLGNLFTVDTQAAWKQMYIIVAKTMQSANN